MKFFFNLLFISVLSFEIQLSEGGRVRILTNNYEKKVGIFSKVLFRFLKHIAIINISSEPKYDTLQVNLRNKI